MIVQSNLTRFVVSAMVSDVDKNAKNGVRIGSGVMDANGSTVGMLVVGICVGRWVNGARDGLGVVGEPVRDTDAGNPLDTNVGSDEVGDPLGNALGCDTVGAEVGTKVGTDEVGDTLGEVVGSEVVGTPVGTEVGLCDVGDKLGDEVGSENVGDSLGAMVG